MQQVPPRPGPRQMGGGGGGGLSMPTLIISAVVVVIALAIFQAGFYQVHEGCVSLSLSLSVCMPSVSKERKKMYS